jgi:predicted DNA-binding protein
MKTSPIRVKERTHKLLKQMAEHEKKTIADVVDAAIERYRRGQLFEVADAAYRNSRGKKDPDMAAWENALADGLGDA